MLGQNYFLSISVAKLWLMVVDEKIIHMYVLEKTTLDMCEILVSTDYWSKASQMNSWKGYKERTYSGHLMNGYDFLNSV